jgi:hypothetical protein
MKIGSLVSSVSREAGGLLEGVRGLAKAMSSADSMVNVFAIRDKNTAADLPQWQPLSVHTSSPLFEAGIIPAGYCRLCLRLISMFCAPMVCGNIAPLPRISGIGGQGIRTLFIHTGCSTVGR